MNFYIKLSTITLIALLFSVSVKAQRAVVPGYQGKKFLVGLNLGYMPSMSGYNSKGNINRLAGADGKYGKNSFFAFSGNYGLELGYTVGRRMVLTASVGRGKSGMEYRGEFTNANNEIVLDDLFYSFKYSFATAGFELSKKKKYGIAPIGPYWGLRALYIKSSDATPEKFSDWDSLNQEYVTTDIADCNCTNIVSPIGETKFNAQLMLGNRRILQNDFYINLGISISFLSWNIEYDTPVERVNGLLSMNGQLAVGKLF